MFRGMAFSESFNTFDGVQVRSRWFLQVRKNCRNNLVIDLSPFIVSLSLGIIYLQNANILHKQLVFSRFLPRRGGQRGADYAKLGMMWFNN